MAYRNLYNPLSQYVDPGSTEIADVLREKYLSAFQAHDAISNSMTDLPVADFANDKLMYDTLYNTTRGGLDKIAERGDYENMFVPVSTLARKYRETAVPLATNYQRYQSDVEEKQKLLNEGKITQSDYTGWLKKSKLYMDPEAGDYSPYKGLEMDKKGMVNKNSYYNSTPIAQYVDVQGEILKALNDIPQVKRGGYKVKELESEGGLVYAITKQGQITEYVPQDAVQAVTQGILNRPDVQSYMMQTADFGTLEASDEDLSNMLMRGAGMFEEEGQSDVAQKIRATVQTGSTGAKRRLARQLSYDMSASNYMRTAMISRQPSVYGGASMVEYESALTNKLASLNGASTTSETPVLLLPGQEFQYSPSQLIDPETQSITPESIYNNIETKTQSQAAVMESLLVALPDLNEMLQDGFLSYEDLTDPGREETVVNVLKQQNPDMDEGTVKQLLRRSRQDISNFQTEIDLSNKIIKDSYGDLGASAISDISSDIGILYEAAVGERLVDSIVKEIAETGLGFVYDEEQNKVSTEKGEGNEEGNYIAIARQVLEPLKSEEYQDVITGSGLNVQEFATSLLGSMFNMSSEDAAELVALASQVNMADPNAKRKAFEEKIKKDMEAGIPLTAGQLINPYGGYGSRISGEEEIGASLSKISTVVENTLNKARKNSEENLKSKANLAYTNAVSSVALGDIDGKASKVIQDELKGIPVSTFAQVPVVPAVGMDTNEGAPTPNSIYGDKISGLTISKVMFGTVPDGSGNMSPSITIQVKPDKNTEMGESPEQITMRWEDAVVGFSDPNFASEILNVTTEGGRMVQKALSVMATYPLDVDEGPTAVPIRTQLDGRDILVEFIPSIRRLEDKNVDVVEGISQILVTATGGGYPDYQTMFNSVAEFIKTYDSILSTKTPTTP